MKAPKTMKRRKTTYFDRDPEAPASLKCAMQRRVNFREVDGMRIVWHGHYAGFFEEISTRLREQCGMSYQDFIDARVAVPIVTCHVDYLRPLLLDEVFTIRAEMFWSDAARINTEYTITKSDGQIASKGYTVQLFIDAESQQPLFAQPPLAEQLQERWKRGDFKDMQ